MIYGIDISLIIYGRMSIKKYQIWSAVINILLIPTCWFFLKIGYEAWIVFLLTIIISILCQIACLIIMHDVFQYSYKEYAFKTIMPCFVMTIIVPLLPFTITRLMEESLLRLLMVCLTSLIVSVTLFYFAFMNVGERNIVHQYILKIAKRHTCMSRN